MDLVADYGSDSDSEEQSTSEPTVEVGSKSGEVAEKSDMPSGASAPQAKTWFDCSDGSSDSDESSGAEQGKEDTQAGTVQQAKESTPLPLPDISTFVPSGEAAIFKTAAKGMYDAQNLPGVKRQRPSYDDPASRHAQHYVDDNSVDASVRDTSPEAKKRRKRHGVTDSLRPPKRAIQPIRNQIHRDQPWMKRKR